MKQNFDSSSRRNSLRTSMGGWCASACLGICALVAAAGCDSGPKLIPISGRVSIDGKPLEMGAVTIWVKDYRPSYGVIGKDGRFVLTTHDTGDGCPAGDFPVTVSSEVSSKGDIMTYYIPKRYKDPKQSNLRIQVDQPRDDWEIELTWKGDSHSAPFNEI
jgi:hypothetical protein